MRSITPYKKRPIEFIKQISFSGWRLKIYGITAVAQSIPEALVTKAVDKVLPHLPKIAKTEDRYGTGFLIIHQGTLRNWFLLDWWELDDILFHKLFSSPLNNVDLITPEIESSAIACVHELRVINFESEAWINTVLCKGLKLGLDQYMNCQFVDC